MIFPTTTMPYHHLPYRHCLVDRILCRILGKRHYRDIEKSGGLYLRRFFLTPRSWPVRIFLHHILLDDDDRALHDHPWPFLTIMLAGAYTEILPHGSREASAGTIRYNPAEHAHRVIIWKPVWTLVFAGRARRDWGFHNPERGWVDHQTYLGQKDDEEASEDTVRKSA